ncbi:DUF6778 family protein [Enterovirga rhinocerotis]|uniref:Lipoprotein n=1 Tax=Enterovirga rhinocerotis TaxID=1339210 RepID=A0A4R7C4M0_9HYPH|nr:DUF6778 family protein [Enterovirga rhinocerotis]TDR93454.1 hypothetical protein EV668_0715 [Enterovirga rhinocerotis]
MRSIVLCLVALALAGCQTMANRLSPAEVAGFRLAQLDVVPPPAAAIRWYDGEVVYAASKGVGMLEASSAAATPEGQAYLQHAVAGKVRAAFQRELGGSLTGTRPVRVQVRMQSVTMIPALQRALIGGGEHAIVADITVLDAKTGAVLSTYPSFKAGSTAGGGVVGLAVDATITGAPIDRVVSNLASGYRAWLMNPGAS